MVEKDLRRTGSRVPAHDELNERLQTLWLKFRPVMLERLKTIAEAISALEGGSLANQARVKAIHAAHKLAGSLGTFGLSAGSTAAREMEKLLSEHETPQDAAKALNNYLAVLEQTIQRKT